ncbi:type II secretion system F family protein [Streptomyces melanosporofaciens]|uniref:Flp pilus assembly protein TadB n=1 Tax=Streptomyces melanosporofaciens TaxID=67327 RepID=A0A1H4KRV3_STRMJ|nr:type II secretion system F family protein [Streptomyces melanosporofaciens]SEB60838.1 Flp pilus assembly protein TadB [Streptomyces melanosporofaciens]
MNGYAALLGLCGLGAATGLIVLVSAWRGSLPTDARTWRRRPRRSVRQPARTRWWMAAAGAAGVLVGGVTGWVIGALLAAMATWSVPRILEATRADQQQTARIEGIAGWTEMLRDTLAAAAGLEQTIMATAHTTPRAIRPHVLGLSARLAGGERLTAGLRRLQADLDDPTADLVIAALMLASEHQARQLTPLLGELAATARTQVQMRQRVDASRTRMRTTVRVVVATTLVFAGGLTLLNPEFLSPYDSATGQLILLLIGAIFTVGFAWLRRMARIEEPERFLTPEPQGDAAEYQGVSR